MIPRAHRFHGYGSLRYVYSHGQTVRGPLFAVKSTLNPQKKTYRLAVVVSRKVNKSAVVRNRIRRRLYEVARQLSPDITGGQDIVITVFHASAADESSSSLTHQIKKQFKQAGILSKSPE